MYLVRGAALALAWLAAVNAVASIVVAATARRLVRANGRRSTAFWLAMRLAPGVASVAFVALLFVPSYWRYEPRELGETFDLTLTALAVLGGALVAAAAGRGISASRAAGRRTRAWHDVSTPLALDAIDVPVFAVDIDTPMMALAGVLRPRLLITRAVLDALTAEELRAGVAHELGHWRARDNLKRLAMRAAPDLLRLTGAAGVLESRWASAAEHDADRRACGDASERCALASALVKVARLTPRCTPLAEPISTLVDGGEIASRVARLLNEAVHDTRRRRRWPVLAIAGAAGVLAFPLLQVVHEVTEILVRTLP
jgi:Zn-dependent protease with chaperone function